MKKLTFLWGLLAFTSCFMFSESHRDPGRLYLSDPWPAPPPPNRPRFDAAAPASPYRPELGQPRPPPSSPRHAPPPPPPPPRSGFIPSPSLSLRPAGQSQPFPGFPQQPSQQRPQLIEFHRIPKPNHHNPGFRPDHPPFPNPKPPIKTTAAAPTNTEASTTTTATTTAELTTTTATTTAELTTTTATTTAELTTTTAKTASTTTTVTSPTSEPTTPTTAPTTTSLSTEDTTQVVTSPPSTTEVTSPNPTTSGNNTPKNFWNKLFPFFN